MRRAPPSSPAPPFPAFPPFPAYPPFPPHAPALVARVATSPGSAASVAQASVPASQAASTGPAAPPPAPGVDLGPPGSRSPFPVSMIALPPDPHGEHEGTGAHQRTLWTVVPSTVAAPGRLQFVQVTAGITSMLFQLATPDPPNWFGVAVPAGTTDFSRANIFMHPIPLQGGYWDVDYPFKGDPTYTPQGKKPWSMLFYLIERLGYQLAASPRPEVLIMPFFPSATTDTGLFAPHWADIVSDILTDARIAMGVPGPDPVDASQIAVSSHSVGIVYSDSFRKRASGLKGVMTSVWDLDGHVSSASALSDGLHSTADYRAIKYDQQAISDPASFHVPGPRWADLPAHTDYPPFTGHGDVHHLIRDFMFLHASTLI